MNILVTGASKGIGNAISKELLQIGNVFVTGRNEEALKIIGAKGYCVCDLTRDVHNLQEFIKENRINVLINNAGEYIYGAIDSASEEEIGRIFETNLLAPVKLISAAVPFMLGQQQVRSALIHVTFLQAEHVTPCCQSHAPHRGGYCSDPSRPR